MTAPPGPSRHLVQRPRFDLKSTVVALGLSLAVWLGAFFAAPAMAQSLSLDLGDGGSQTRLLIQLIALVTVLSLAPTLLVMVTSFTRIIVVLSLLRFAIGIQQSPPNTVLVALALFLTAFIMAPTFEAAWNTGVLPYVEEEIDEATAITSTIAPFREFMISHVREEDVGLFVELSQTGPVLEPDDIPLQALIPAFMISELRRAFEIGFMLFLPFLIIDMVVASILMSMGMMMLPPIIIAMPFKIIFFVLVDGWYLLAGSLVQSYGVVPG